MYYRKNLRPLCHFNTVVCTIRLINQTKPLFISLHYAHAFQYNVSSDKLQQDIIRTFVARPSDQICLPWKRTRVYFTMSIHTTHKMQYTLSLFVCKFNRPVLILMEYTSTTVAFYLQLDNSRITNSISVHNSIILLIMRK